MAVKIEKLQRPENNLEYIQISSQSQNSTPVKHYHSNRAKKKKLKLIRLIVTVCLVRQPLCPTFTHLIISLWTRPEPERWAKKL